MVEYSCRSRNVPSFVPLNFTVLYVVRRFPLISDATSLIRLILNLVHKSTVQLYLTVLEYTLVVISLLVSDMSKNHALHGGQAA